MKFVQITGAELLQLVEPDEIAELRRSGITNQSKIRVNQQGDIEILQSGTWTVVGGLLGDFESRIKRITGLDWS